MSLRTIRVGLFLSLLMLIAPVVSVGQEADSSEPGPLKVIVFSGGKWIFVETVEERNGSIIYQKEGGRPTAAKENSLDTRMTMEVNEALAILFDACSGEDQDLAALFDRSVIDGAVNGVASAVRSVGSSLRSLQTGYVRNSALGIVMGSAGVVLWFLSRLWQS